MRRHRPIMNALRGQLCPPESNPGLPSGVTPPSVWWLENNCQVTVHDYGNNNVQHIFTCEHVGSGGRFWRCTWSNWVGQQSVQLIDCVEITRPHYHDVHGGGEGPQSYGTPQLPPYVPMTGAQAYHYGRWGTRTNPFPVTQKIREAAHRFNPEGPFTPACPLGQEPCPADPDLCCPIPIKGPTPASASRRRRRLSLRDRIRHAYNRVLGR